MPSLPPFPVYRVWIEEAAALAARLGVLSAPTLKLYVNDAPVHTWFGARTSEDLYYILSAYLNPWRQLYGDD